MKLQIKSLLTLTFALVVSTSAVSQASAHMYQSQSQSSSQKTSFSCEGDNCGSTKWKSSQKLEQSQSQGTGSFRNYNNGTAWKKNRGWKSDKYVNRDTSGKIRLDWDHRGGTCHVRYTEANMQWYKYYTSIGCDDGAITIGGLQSGVAYRFQVKKDNGGWSNPVTATAN